MTLDSRAIEAAQVLRHLEAAVRHAGSQQALARAIGISAQHLNDMMRARKPVTGKALDYLGLRSMTIYLPKETKAHEPR